MSVFGGSLFGGGNGGASGNNGMVFVMYSPFPYQSSQKQTRARFVLQHLERPRLHHSAVEACLQLHLHPPPLAYVPTRSHCHATIPSHEPAVCLHLMFVTIVAVVWCCACALCQLCTSTCKLLVGFDPRPPPPPLTLTLSSLFLCAGRLGLWRVRVWWRCACAQPLWPGCCPRCVTLWGLCLWSTCACAWSVWHAGGSRTSHWQHLRGCCCTRHWLWCCCCASWRLVRRCSHACRSPGVWVWTKRGFWLWWSCPNWHRASQQLCHDTGGTLRAWPASARRSVATKLTGPTIAMLLLFSRIMTASCKGMSYFAPSP